MATKATKQHTAWAARLAKLEDEASAAFPDRFRALRLHLGLSEAEMSRRLSMSLDAWLCWERGQRKGVSMKMFSRLAEEFDVSLDWLSTGCCPCWALARRNDNLPLGRGGEPLRVNSQGTGKERAI